MEKQLHNQNKEILFPAALGVVVAMIMQDHSDIEKIKKILDNSRSVEKDPYQDKQEYALSLAREIGERIGSYGCVHHMALLRLSDKYGIDTKAIYFKECAKQGVSRTASRKLNISTAVMQNKFALPKYIRILECCGQDFL